MLTKKQLVDANRYNAQRVGDKKLDVNDLPWPWSEVAGSEFVWATALFQCDKSLTVDGKLGPTTEKSIKKGMDDTTVERPQPSTPSVVPPDRYSNAIIVNGVSVKLPDEFLAAGLTASNFEDDGEIRFKHRQRSADLVHFVLHETCGNTAQGCMSTLQKKGYGVQLIMASNGHISCHGDLVRDYMVHANQLNDSSFGIEVVNPYAPQYVRDKAIWSNIVPAEWWTWCPDKKDRRYVTPTGRQMAAIRLLAPWLCRITGVPYRFPTKGLNKKKRQIDGLTLKPRGRPGPGIVAHRDFASHSDGRYMLEDLIGRV